MIEVIASNIGGTATLIGDPPNIIIAGAHRPQLQRVHRQPGADRRRRVRRRHPAALPLVPAASSRSRSATAITSWSSTRRPRSATRPSCAEPGPVLVATILLFFIHQPLHIEPATVALTGAAVAPAADAGSTCEEALAEIEWPTLFFFVALFVMVGALEETGAIDEVADARRRRDRRRPHGRAVRDPLGRGARLGRRRQHPLHHRDAPGRRAAAGPARAGDDAYWWALSLGACFGGNATIIAAAANVAAAGLTERAGRPIGFIAFLKVGVPVTLDLAR